MVAFADVRVIAVAAAGAVLGTVVGLHLAAISPLALYASATTVRPTMTAAAAAAIPLVTQPSARAAYAADVRTEAAAGLLPPPATRGAPQVGPLALVAGAAVAFAAAALAWYRGRTTAMAAAAGERDVEGGWSRRDVLRSAATYGLVAVAGPATAAAKSVADAEAEYRATTSAVLQQMKAVLNTPKGDEALEGAVASLRGAMTEWISMYRRSDRFEGRASYGKTYTAINALAGHYTSVGNAIPLPPKRAANAMQSILAAEELVVKGR